MSKKFTAEEAARAVLQKAEDMYKSSKLSKCGPMAKANNDFAQKGVGHAQGPGGVSDAGAQLRFNNKLNSHSKGDQDTTKQVHKQTIRELKAMPKPNLTKEENVTPPDGVQKQGLEQHNPAAMKENGNPPWGTEPGCHKLSKFMGRREERKSAKASLAVTQTPAAKPEVK